MYYIPEKSCFTCIHSIGAILEGYKNWCLVCTMKECVAKEVCDAYSRESGADEREDSNA